jgi:hypothetical protein
MGGLMQDGEFHVSEALRLRSLLGLEFRNPDDQVGSYGILARVGVKECVFPWTGWTYQRIKEGCILLFLGVNPEDSFLLSWGLPPFI